MTIRYFYRHNTTAAGNSGNPNSIISYGSSNSRSACSMPCVHTIIIRIIVVIPKIIALNQTQIRMINIYTCIQNPYNNIRVSKEICFSPRRNSIAVKTDNSNPRSAMRTVYINRKLSSIIMTPIISKIRIIGNIMQISVIFRNRFFNIALIF